MSEILNDRKYTKDHEWIRLIDDSTAEIGITDHAQEMLTDIVFVELPEPGTAYDQGAQVAVVESVKTVSDVYAPIGGSIKEVNSELEDTPELVNSDPYGQGWIYRLEISNSDELTALLDHGGYRKYVEEGENS